MSNVDVLTSSDAVKRKNGRSAEDEFIQEPETLLEWKQIVLNEEYKLSRSIREYRYIYFIYSCTSSGSLSNNTLVPTKFIGNAHNAIMLNNIITSSMCAYVQSGFKDDTTFVATYIENKNTNDAFKKFYLRICGIR